MASIADVYVTVLPETGKIASGIEKALRDVDVKAIAETWKTKIEQALKGVEAKVDIKVDSAKAKAEIERATGDKKATIEVETDGVVKAEAEIDAAARDRKTKIKVDVDKGAGAGILGLAANLTAQGFQAISTGAQAAGAGMQVAGQGAQVASTAFASVSKSTAALGVTLVALVPVMGAVAGVAAAMAGALALLPAAFSAVGAGAGVLMVGLSGITDAYEAVSGAAKSAGKDARDHASKVQSASRTVTSAQQSLSSAVRSEAQAQKEVARARRDALHELQDINDELRNGAIDETQAQIDLAKAREELATGTFDSSLDYQQAQLNVIKAEQRLKESHEGNIELETKVNDERAKGVEGADAVVAANERLAEAQQNTANAQTALIDAQTQLAQANNEVSTSAQKAADAMGGLSPNAQALVNTLVGLQPVWEQFRNSLQDPLTANLGPMITNAINTVLPAIQPGLVRISEAFNGMFGQISEWLQNPENVAMIQTIVNNIAAAFEQLKPAVQPFLTALGTITSVGSDFFPGFGHAIADAATAFSNFITEAQKSGELKEFIMKAVFAFQELGKLMPDILWLIGRFADIGVQAMPGIVDAIRLVIKAIGFIAPAFVAPFDALHKLVELCTWVKDKVGDLADWFGKAWDAAGNIIQSVWDQKMKPFFSKIIEGVNWVIRGLNKLPLVDIPEIDVPAWYSGGGGGFDSGLPSAAAGSDVSQSRSENRTSTAGAPPVVPAPPGGPAPVIPQPGGSGIPGGPPASSAPSDGTRVFVTNWPAGGVGGGGTVTTTAPPGVNPAAPSGGGVPIIPDPNRPGFFTSSNPEWAKLIKRESGGAPAVTQSIQDANSAAGTPATGLFQITTPTWLSNGGGEFAPTAREATPEQQGVVAARIFAARGGQPWGAVAGGGREDEAALRAGLAPGTSPTMPSPAGPPGVVGGGARVPYGLAPGSDSGGYGGTGVQFPAWTGAVTQQFGVKPSTYPGHQEGQSHAGEPGYAPNPQGLNRGIDWKGTPAQMRALAEWAMQNPGAFEQLIYWDPETGKKYGIAGGKDVTNTGYYENKEGYPAHGGPGNLAGAHVHTRQSMSWGPGAGDSSATGGPTGISAAGDSHTISLDQNVPLGQQGSAKDKGKDYGKDLGANIISGMMEVFGLGDIFPDPTQFGIFKIFKSLLAIKPGSSTNGASNGGSTNAGSGSGTGDPLMDLLSSIIPNANGTGGLAGLGAWQPPPGSPASGQGAGAPPGPVDKSFNVFVQGDAGPKALDNMDTTHTSTLRNMPNAGGN